MNAVKRTMQVANQQMMVWNTCDRIICVQYHQLEDTCSVKFCSLDDDTDTHTTLVNAYYVCITIKTEAFLLNTHYTHRKGRRVSPDSLKTDRAIKIDYDP